jgi:hypothetical protein
MCLHAFRRQKNNNNNKISPGAFLDIKVATSFDAIASAVRRRHGVQPTTCTWITSMLESRIIVASLMGDTLRISTSR